MKAELVDNRLVVWSIRDSRSLFASGYYGKPIGMSKPKPEEIDAPLILDLMEGYYLQMNRSLQVTGASARISAARMHDICMQEYHDFDRKYQVYRDFRDKGYVINPGIKFGCDFAVYERGPGIDHAPYLVQVCNSREAIATTAIVLAGRLATTVRKQFIFAIPRASGVDYMALDWWKA